MKRGATAPSELLMTLAGIPAVFSQAEKASLYRYKILDDYLVVWNRDLVTKVSVESALDYHHDSPGFEFLPPLVPVGGNNLHF
ncbi:hypothetical protein Bpfe_002899 [Biomphalaria pfeifferi]|uniref:Uncharacterized protein n=1 Tax=Biomphalaria pfeifferi TaxID=112525 RepID=A0AAD8C6I6_BIOPF|nr:hypothetical protein Bpfe_002899 [Biomphalaria pfeifferi]